MRDLSKPINNLNLIDRMDRRRQPAVHAEDLIVDDDAEGEKVEHVGEVVPDVGVAVFAGAFGVEAVGLGDAAGLVVAADEVDAVWVAEFEADEEGDGFDAEEAAVDVVS